MSLLFLPMPIASVYFLKRDPQLVERRLRTEEKIGEQKAIIRWVQLVFFGSLLIPGLDYRFGWSRVPLWLTILSLFFVFAGYLITLWVMKENSFASRTVQVEKGQKVISTGPYRLVRHPMYFGAVLMLLFTPLALGSWWALPGFLLAIPLIVLRLLNEEKMLCRDLPGYSDYCLRTRSRLLPLLWDVRALPVEQVLELGMQIAAALQTAHGKLGWERQQKRKDLRDQNPSRRAVRARTIPGAFPAIRKLSRLLGASTFRVRLRLSLFSHADRPSAS